MTIPDFQMIMLPLLRIASDGTEHQMRAVVEMLAEEFSLTGEELSQLLPSGKQAIFFNRTGWARTYLKQAGLIESPRRGVILITSRGREVLGENPDRINVNMLERFPEFLEFRTRSTGTKPLAKQLTQHSTEQSSESPEDLLASAYLQVRGDLEVELLQQVKDSPPAFFENLVIDLLVAMGYGGSRQDAGQALGRSGDEGIDGVINEDHLGLDVIYVQAKRWENTVGRPEIQKFAGALQGQRARKGVFITTANFSREAQEYSSQIESKIILIDGARLARLMVDHGVGVSTVGVYEVKKIDSDYFPLD
jgi:restriction system protein